MTGAGVVSVDFYSDNLGAAVPEILDAIARVDAGAAPAYGADAATQSLARQLKRVFERDDLTFALVGTGTAANGISLALTAPPFTAIYCHDTAHILLAEAGAAEFFTGGARLVPVTGAGTRIDPSLLEQALAAAAAKPFLVQASTLSLCQSTDYGAVYGVEEVRRLTAIAARFGLKVHMDGARFANAVAAEGCTPADLSWRAGVDVLSLGITKNGGLSTELVVVFDPALGADLPRVQRRTGQLASKMRYAAVQALAYFQDDLWLRLAANANAAARTLAERVAAIPGVALARPVATNLVLLRLDDRLARRLDAGGLRMLRKDGGEHRLVCRPDTSREEVDAVVDLFRRCTGMTEAAAERQVPA